MPNKLLPKQADNNYTFHRVILVIFATMTVFPIGGRLAHMFLPE